MNSIELFVNSIDFSIKFITNIPFKMDLFVFIANFCLLIKLDARIVEDRPVTYSSVSHFSMDTSAQRKFFLTGCPFFFMDASTQEKIETEHPRFSDF